MSDVVFNLPLNKETLLESSDSYYVKSVCIVSQIKDQVKQAKQALHYDGPEAILNHFDTYYSVIYHGEKLDITLVENTLKELIKPCQQLSVYLEAILESNISEDIQMKTLNILKMLIYLFSQMTMLLENMIENKNRNDLNMLKKGGRGKGKTKKSVDDDFDVESKRKHLNIFMRILQLPIYKLWEPPVCEEQFINLIADMAFSFVINPAVRYEKEMSQLIFYIFGILIKNYSYSLTFTVRLTQAIKDYEHLELIVPTGIQILVEEYNCTSLVRELVRELTEWQSDENYQDLPGSKHCSVILTEMTALMPSLMLPEVVYLLKYLNSNSYTLRNCILSITTEVVLKVLSDENITEEQIEIRNKLLYKLEIHICDVNAHVRSKVLQQWTRLHIETAIPKDILAKIVKKTSGRLKDKGSLVRKSAIQLMTTFLKYNPFAASLDYDYYKNELDAEIDKCKSLTSDNTSNDMFEKIKNKEVEWNSMKDEIKIAIEECLKKGNDEEDMEVETNNNDKEYVKELIMSGEYKKAFYVCKEFIHSNKENNTEMKEMEEQNLPNFYLAFMQTIYTDLNKNAEDLIEINLNCLAQLTPEQIEQIKRCEETINYLNDVVTFLDIMNNDVFPLIINLLKSSTISDVNESIEFIITAHQFKLKQANDGLAAMLTQMNTTEQDRKKLVIDAYRNVFLTYEGPLKDKPRIIVNRLINLLKNINAADVYYLSTVIMQWTEKGDLEHSIIQELWHMFIGQITNIKDDDRIAVLQILAMIARGRKTVIERNMNLVAELVFGDICLQDPRFLIFGCEMLGLMEDDIDINSKNPSFRVDFEDPMWEHLLDKVITLFKKKDPYCHAVLTACVELIYKICSKPDSIATKLLKTILSDLKDPSGNIYVDGKMDPSYLALLCHLLGEIAIRQFTFLDTTVFKELKRRNNIKEETKKSQKKTKNFNISKASANRTPNIHNAYTGDDAEESYLEGAQADDVDAEYILLVCEREIVSSNLLGNFVTFLVHIVRHPHRFTLEELQASAVQALMRFMIVSSQVCNEHLQLIMTVLERSKYSSVKNNIFVAMADLLHRFPNIIEPWSQQIFKVVKDEDVTVRMTAVSILSKLIMEDMLRVKGTIADLALCIVDKSETIVQMTEEFFHLLSQKGNTIYNVLPDIISRLSNDKEQINQDIFKKVMTFLVQLISKDKHIESLVEKLCLRFKLSDKERVWRDIAFCLTLLSYNEKSLLRLEENFPSYKICLEDDIVYELLMSIINKYKNNHKDEIKNIIKKIDQLIRTGEVAAEETDLNATAKSKKKSAKKGKGKKAKVQFSCSDD